MHPSALQARLCRRPVRNDGICYEIHGDIGALFLSRARLKQCDGIWVSGAQELLDIKPSSLFRWLRAAEELRIPIRQRPLSTGVLDGDWVEISLCNSNQAMATFSWEAHRVPEGWEPLAKLVDLGFEEFEKLEPAHFVVPTAP